MSEALQYLAFVLIVTVALVVVFSLMKNSFTKYRHIYINNVEDLSKHYYRYVLYFWGVGVFVPFSELYVELFSVRKESELFYNIIGGLFCLGIAFFSRYVAFIRNNLHRLFSAFFVVYNSSVIYKIATIGQMDFLTLAEFTLVNMISYYVFYSFKYFYTYLLAIVGALLILFFLDIISIKDFIIYFNSSFIAFIINYVIHYIDLNIKENLFFAYNFVNRGNLLIIGVNQDEASRRSSSSPNHSIVPSSDHDGTSQKKQPKHPYHTTTNMMLRLDDGTTKRSDDAIIIGTRKPTNRSTMVSQTQLPPPKKRSSHLVEV